MYTHIHVLVHTCAYICTYIVQYMCMYMYLYVYINYYAHTCTCICTCTDLLLRIFVCSRIKLQKDRVSNKFQIRLKPWYPISKTQRWRDSDICHSIQKRQEGSCLGIISRFRLYFFKFNLMKEDTNGKFKYYSSFNVFEHFRYTCTCTCIIYNLELY